MSISKSTPKKRTSKKPVSSGVTSSPAKRKTNSQLVSEAKEWVKNLKVEAHVNKIATQYIELTVSVEPEPQVRQTGASGQYRPGPIKYNGWKHKVAEAIKVALRKAKLGTDGKNLFDDNPVCFTAKFYVTNSRRFKVCDLSNYLKAIEDAINYCSNDSTAYDDGSKARGIWKDDCKIFAYGKGMSKIWEPDPKLARIEITIESISLESEPKKK